MRRIKKSQLDIVRDKVLNSGLVSRNWCLRRGITRLSAHIDMLRRNGLGFHSEYVKRGGSRDYVYYLIFIERGVA